MRHVLSGIIYGRLSLVSKELVVFLTQYCKERGLSLRSLSLNAGLSPGTVHSIVKMKCNPNVSTLNSLADYIGVKREFLWQLAGLLEDMDYSTETTFSDPEVKFHFAQVDKLPKNKRHVILSVIQALILNLKEEDSLQTSQSMRIAERSRGRRGYKSKPTED